MMKTPAQQAADAAYAAKMQEAREALAKIGVSAFEIVALEEAERISRESKRISPDEAITRATTRDGIKAIVRHKQFHARNLADMAECVAHRLNLID